MIRIVLSNKSPGGSNSLAWKGTEQKVQHSQSSRLLASTEQVFDRTYLYNNYIHSPIILLFVTFTWVLSF
jgi:hypothetical protein